MTADELAPIVAAVRNLTRWDSSVPMIHMIDTMWKHADAFVELMLACERWRETDCDCGASAEDSLGDGLHRDSCADVMAGRAIGDALDKVHAVGKGGG